MNSKVSIQVDERSTTNSVLTDQTGENKESRFSVMSDFPPEDPGSRRNFDVNQKNGPWSQRISMKFFINSFMSLSHLGAQASTGSEAFYT